MYPPLLGKKMTTIFANMLKVLYYEHMMGCSAQQFTNVVVVADHIEQGVKSCRISTPVEKKGFERKKKEVVYVKDGYRGKKNQFQKYNTSYP